MAFFIYDLRLGWLFPRAFFLAVISFTWLSNCPTSYATVSLDLGFPRGFSPEQAGVYQFTNPTGIGVRVVATDTDEGSTEILTTSDTYFSVTVAGPGLLTKEPHDFDSGDWAYSLAIYPDNFSPIPLFFFQTRIAGSTAIVSDQAPATSATTAGLWSSADDYFEFNPAHAVVFSTPSPPTGPGSFGSSIFPEPASLTMLLLAGCCLPSRIRRTAS